MLASFLEGLKGGKVPVEIYIRGKDADENAEQLKKCAEIIKSSGVRKYSFPFCLTVLIITLTEEGRRTYQRDAYGPFR